MTAVLLECPCEHGILIATRAQSRPHKTSGRNLLRGRPCLPRKKEKPRLEDKKNEQKKIRKQRAECPDYCPIE